MIEKERLEAILQYLRQNKFSSIHEIVKLTNSSEATIRRDFDKLAKEKRIKRLWGGVEITEVEAKNSLINSSSPQFELDSKSHSDAKRRIAASAANLIEDGETIFIDGGSTAFYLAEFIQTLSLTVITSSFPVIEYLIRNGNSKVIVPEGIIYPDSLIITNPFNPNPYKNYQASKVFLGAGGIKNQKITNLRIDLIHNQRSMVEHADEVILVADSSKFGKSNSYYLFDLDAHNVQTVITDDGISESEATIIREKGIRLIIV
jgi:DeoR family ulaG and ulaABCDEF operon transcriptional repressor